MNPETARNTDPLWSTLGQQISKQECLYRDFEVEFGGDMERYLTFFTYQGGVRRSNSHHRNV